jgi:ATP synthase protein I
VNNGNNFREYVFRKAERMQRARSSKQRFWAGLALVGSVGWMIVLPMVGGVMCGKWLDERLETNLSFTLGFLMLGFVIGAYSVWRVFMRDLT